MRRFFFRLHFERALFLNGPLNNEEWDLRTEGNASPSFMGSLVNSMWLSVSADGAWGLLLLGAEGDPPAPPAGVDRPHPVGPLGKAVHCPAKVGGRAPDGEEDICGCLLPRATDGGSVGAPIVEVWRFICLLSDWSAACLAKRQLKYPGSCVVLFARGEAFESCYGAVEHRTRRQRLVSTEFFIRLGCISHTRHRSGQWTMRSTRRVASMLHNKWMQVWGGGGGATLGWSSMGQRLLWRARWAGVRSWPRPVSCDAIDSRSPMALLI